MPEDQRTFPWSVCYDFEALLQKANDLPTESLQWTHRHIPISVSICSNVEGHIQPLCIVEQDQDRLVQLMVSALDVIACRVNQLSEEKWGWVLEAIDEKLIKEKSEGETCKGFFKEDSQDELDQEEKESQRNKTVIN